MIARLPKVSLAEEKEKIDHGHRLEIRRILLEKFLLALLIGLAGYVGNLIVEDYKSDLAKTQFLLDRRLEALKDIRVSFSKLNQHAFNEVFAPESAKPAEHTADVLAFMHTVNRWGFLFSEDFNGRLNNYAWLHQAIADPMIILTKTQWNFVADFAQTFDFDTRTALNVEVLKTPPQSEGKHHRLQLWKQDEILKKGTAALFDENFAKWQREKNR